MQLKPLFYTIFKSLNPDSYPELNQHKFSYALKYFFFITILSIILMFMLFVPSIVNFHTFWTDKTNNFQVFQLNTTFSTNQSFNLFTDPVIKVANGFENLTDAKILITPDAIYYRTFYFFGATHAIPLDNNLDIKNSQTMKSKITMLIIFMLPSLFFWSIVFFSIYFWVIIIITFLIAYMFLWAFRLNINALTLLKTCIFASTILITLQLILMPFYRIIVIPLSAYWLLLIIVLLLIKDELKPHGKSKVLLDGVYSGKSKNIFGKQQDNFDIDENGNIKSETHKGRKSFDEEDNGYVMLK